MASILNKSSKKLWFAIFFSFIIRCVRLLGSQKDFLFIGCLEWANNKRGEREFFFFDEIWLLPTHVIPQCRLPNDRNHARGESEREEKPQGIEIWAATKWRQLEWKEKYLHYWLSLSLSHIHWCRYPRI